MTQRVAVFIDHTNVWYRLKDMRKIDHSWAKWYDPSHLAQVLAGARNLVHTAFYCAPPPPYLLKENDESKEKYWRQMSYYQAIQNNKSVTVKFATLKGVKGDLREKNLDSQLCSDLIEKAALNEYDTGIIVANDMDYVSAVASSKRLGRKIELYYFKNQPCMELRSICDVARRARRAHFKDLAFTVNEGESST